MYETYLLSGRRAPFLVRGWLYGVLIQMADRHLIVGPTQVMSLTLGNKFHVTVWSPCRPSARPYETVIHMNLLQQLQVRCGCSAEGKGS